MRIKMPSLIMFIILVSLLFYATRANSEDITITTYYPSPYGSYRELRSYYMAVGSAYSGAAYTDGDLVAAGKVGLGTPTPAVKLDIIDDSQDASFRTRHSNLSQGISIGFNTIKANGSNTNQGIGIMPKGTGGVGIGTNNPDQKLHVVGSVKIVDGNQGAGKVLTSDANGVGTWQSGSSDIWERTTYLGSSVVKLTNNERILLYNRLTSSQSIDANAYCDNLTPQHCYSINDLIITCNWSGSRTVAGNVSGGRDDVIITCTGSRVRSMNMVTP